MVLSPTLIYHITHISNLGSIIKGKGLVSTNTLQVDKSPFMDIAYGEIQLRRSEKNVPLPPYGKLHDYVPFYFAPRSPMLYTINRGNVRHYQGGQQEIIYLVSSVQRVQEKDIPFVFTDGHAVIGYSEFFNEVKDLDQVDWGVMTSHMWTDTVEAPDRKRRRQAEFLAFKQFPLDCVIEVGTFNRSYSDKVMSDLGEFNIPVKSRRDWYY